MDKVEEFIKDMKGFYEVEMQVIFYNGYCYWFAMILAQRFNGEIWFNPKIVHFATKIENDLYDIFGKILPGINPFFGFYQEEYDCWYKWEDYQKNNIETVDEIVSSCIKKDKKLPIGSKKL